MATENTQNFFENLPLLDSFFKASDPSNFHPIPEDWHVAVTDIENSTEAVNKGEYKSVNILGASSIVGMLNKANRSQIPFTFGGDGCAICIPATMLDTARNVLAASREIGKAAYGLNLRAAIIPMKLIREAGYDVKVARFKVSEVYAQAVFRGGGLTYAEDLLKSPEHSQYQIKESGDTEATDFTGLECRWQEVGQRDKKVITILAKANTKLQDADEVYRQVLRKMEEIFDFDSQTNPIAPEDLQMNMSIQKLMGEIKFRTFGLNIFQRLLYILKIELQILLGKLFMKFNYRSSATDWALYKPDLALNSDHRKFDDMLRVVIAGSEEQCKEMRSFLQEQFEASHLAYGIHVTDKAMITCMVFQYHREHIHFVDGSDGGYVQASKTLKKQLKSFE